MLRAPIALLAALAASLLAGCATAPLDQPPSTEDSSTLLKSAARVRPNGILEELFTLQFPPEDNNPQHNPHIAAQTAVFLGDLNGDDEPDFFVIPNRTGHRARLFVSTPAGYQPTAGDYDYGYYVKPHDFDDDGLPDILIKGGQAAERNLQIYMIDRSPGIINPDSRLVLWQTLSGNESFDYIDVDRNGTLDLVVLHHFALGDSPENFFNISYYTGTGSRSLETRPFRLRQRLFIPEFGTRQAIRWGSVMHRTSRRRGRFQGTRLYLTGAEGLAHPLGYLEFNRQEGRFETTLRRIDDEDRFGITVRVRRNTALFSTKSGALAYERRGRRGHDLIFETRRWAVDLFSLDTAAHQEVLGVVQRGGSRRIRLFMRAEGAAAGFTEISAIGIPRFPRYVSYYHSTRGLVKYHAPDRLILAHGNGATVYRMNLPDTSPSP